MHRRQRLAPVPPRALHRSRRRLVLLVLRPTLASYRFHNHGGLLRFTRRYDGDAPTQLAEMRPFFPFPDEKTQGDDESQAERQTDAGSDRGGGGVVIGVGERGGRDGDGGCSFGEGQAGLLGRRELEGLVGDGEGRDCAVVIAGPGAGAAGDEDFARVQGFCRLVSCLSTFDSDGPVALRYIR